MTRLVCQYAANLVLDCDTATCYPQVLATRLKRVALVLERQVGYREQVLRGIRRFVTMSGGWTCFGGDLRTETVRAVREWNPDGIITGIWDPGPGRELLKLKKPIVDVFNWIPDIKVPRIGVGDIEIGRLAAEHLLDCGLRHFAFVGSSTRFSTQRRLGFVQALAAASPTVQPCVIEEDFWTYGSWTYVIPRLHEFLRDLPKPLGVMAANDQFGAVLVTTCASAGIKVPEEVAVVGVDNDEFLCTLCQPALSSVATDGERVGFDAAALLDRLIDGEPPPSRMLLIPPSRVVVRPSTDVLSTDDREIAAALRLVRQAAITKFRMADLLRKIPMRRRTLERRFKQVVGHNILDEVQKVRIAKACELLAYNDLTLAQIATRCGFPHAQRLCNVFRKAMGKTPKMYREQHRFQV